MPVHGLWQPRASRSAMVTTKQQQQPAQVAARHAVSAGSGELSPHGWAMNTNSKLNQLPYNAPSAQQAPTEHTLLCRSSCTALRTDVNSHQGSAPH